MEAPNTNSDSNVVNLPRSVPSNREIVEGLIQGDSNIASIFHLKFGAQISRWVWRLLGGDPHHDDIVHQVYVNILSSIHSLRGMESLGDWIDSVTIRTVRKELRRRKYRRHVQAASDYVETTHDRSNPEKNVVVKRFYAILDRMSLEDRILYVMRYLEGNSLEDVANKCDCSLSTVKRRLARAKRAFEKRAVKDAVLASVMESYSHGS